jgi:DNA mismatch repair protein MutS2
MAQFSYAINKVPGLRFIAGALEVRSAIGRLHLMKQQMMTSGKEIEFHLDRVDELRNLMLSGIVISSETSQLYIPDGLAIGNSKNTSDFKTQLDDLRHALTDVHDITGTLNALQQGVVLDDLGLFEVKKFALITDHLKEILFALNTKVVEFADLSQVILLLDPDKQRVPHFFVYDSYSAELADLRKEYNTAVKQDPQKAEELRLKSVEIEDEIREKADHRQLTAIQGGTASGKSGCCC